MSRFSAFILLPSALKHDGDNLLFFVVVFFLKIVFRESEELILHPGLITKREETVGHNLHFSFIFYLCISIRRDGLTL
jgi:hypothetical protein